MVAAEAEVGQSVAFNVLEVFIVNCFGGCQREEGQKSEDGGGEDEGFIEKHFGRYGASSRIERDSRSKLLRKAGV